MEVQRLFRIQFHEISPTSFVVPVLTFDVIFKPIELSLTCMSKLKRKKEKKNMKFQQAKRTTEGSIRRSPIKFVRLSVREIAIPESSVHLIFK